MMEQVTSPFIWKQCTYYYSEGKSPSSIEICGICWLMACRQRLNFMVNFMSNHILTFHYLDKYQLHCFEFSRHNKMAGKSNCLKRFQRFWTFAPIFKSNLAGTIINCVNCGLIFAGNPLNFKIKTFRAKIQMMPWHFLNNQFIFNY